MKCKDCPYRKDLAVKDDHAFDTRYAVKFTKDIDYCTHHLMPCEDAYLECEYRDITVEAHEIQSVLYAIESHVKHKEIYSLDGVVKQLSNILKGENLE